jgi:hypothetical protein
MWKKEDGKGKKDDFLVIFYMDESQACVWLW